MPRRDMLSNTKQVISIEAQSLAEDAVTLTGSLVDRAGFEGAVAEFNIGSLAAGVTGGSVTCKIYHGEESDGSDLADSEQSVTYTFEAGKKAIKRILYAGIKRYIACYIDNSFTGGDAGTNTAIVAGNIMLTHPREAPVTQTY